MIFPLLSRQEMKPSISSAIQRDGISQSPNAGFINPNISSAKSIRLNVIMPIPNPGMSAL